MAQVAEATESTYLAPRHSHIDGSWARFTGPHVLSRDQNLVPLCHFMCNSKEIEADSGWIVGESS